MDIEIYHCTPRQVRAHVIDCMRAGLVPFVRSSPGMGKSSIMRSIAEEFNLKLIDHRLSTSAPEDMSGLPMLVDGYACFRPFADLFPVADTPLPAGRDGWMVFLDEANSGTKMVQAASYKLVLDKMVGQFPLHERVVLTMAGNLDTDRAITLPLSTALQSRVVHLQMEISFEEWLEDVAYPQNYDSRIIGYLHYKGGKDALMDFRPDHQDKTFCSPRTWEFMNRLVKDQDVTIDKIALYAGTITSGVAVDFVTFAQVFESLPDRAAIAKDPMGVPVPTDKPTQWAAISHLAEYLDKSVFGPFSDYVNRFGLDFRIMFFRSVMSRHPELRSHPAFAKAMIDLSRYLHDK